MNISILVLAWWLSGVEEKIRIENIYRFLFFGFEYWILCNFNIFMNVVSENFHLSESFPHKYIKVDTLSRNNILLIRSPCAVAGPVNDLQIESGLLFAAAPPVSDEWSDIGYMPPAAARQTWRPRQCWETGCPPRQSGPSNWTALPENKFQLSIYLSPVKEM